MASEGKKKSVRAQIQESIEIAERERKREHFRRRIDLARVGVRAYQNKQFPQAVTALTSYLHILEEIKEAGPGGLAPEKFDRKAELPELLLITGIYWDLAKLFDHTKSPERLREFRLYLQKYVQFSRGMPYEALSTETLRKYIAVEKPVNRTEFRSAYKQLSNGKCFIATSLVDHCAEPTLPLLRRFRDEKLLSRPAGRWATHVYYATSPTVAWVLDRAPEPMRRLAAHGLDRLARALI